MDRIEKLQQRKLKALEAVRVLLAYIGDDPNRPGLVDTPQRVLKAWEQSWGHGYREIGPETLLTLFEPHGVSPFPERDKQQFIHATFDEMVVVRDITMYSHCEHHLAPFFGVAHVAYVPSALGIVGLSKLARVVDHFARRLQVQERLCVQIADFLAEHLSAHVGVQIKATHMCMVSRGVQQPHAQTVTTALRGNLSSGEPRAEFLQACQG